MPSRFLRRLVTAALLGLLLLASNVEALECDPGICAGNPCTIHGFHSFEPFCELDFTGKDVTLAPNGGLVSNGFGVLVIVARSLEVQGSIEAGGSYLEIDTDGDFITKRGRQGPGSLLGTLGSQITINAGGNVLLDGTIFQSLGPSPSVCIMANDIHVDSWILITTNDEGSSLELMAAGSITVTRPVTMIDGPFAGPIIGFEAGGDITIDSPINMSGPSGDFEANAGGTLSVNGPMTFLDTAFGGSPTALLTGQNISIQNKVIAKAAATAPDQGTIDVEAGQGNFLQNGGNVQIGGTLDVTAQGNGFSDGFVTVNACNLTVNGNLKAGANGGIALSYLGTFDATGGSLRSGTNEIACRCLDANNDGRCDGSCVNPPVGLDPRKIKPSATIQPFASAACS